MSQRDDSSSPAVDETLHWESGALSRDLTGVTLGDFLVERLLGRGGMGEVYLARQISLNRPVALKVLRPDLLTKPIYLSRFEAEATAVAKLNHPNIVHIYTLGATEGVRFIAMEYVQGTNLREYIKKKGALEYPLALSIMKQAGVAVGAAGELGLVHRDIKPENLLLTKKGQVKIADFGLCRDLDADRVNLTQPGITMGTPAYMSPEQAQGQALDHRSDLYSLGVTFYHMLAGVPPFTADSPLALALKHVKDAPVSPRVHRPDMPPDLERLVLKLMAKSPADRYQSAAEMLRDLAKVRESLSAPSGAQPVADVTGPFPTFPEATEVAPEAAEPTRSSRAPVAAGVDWARLLKGDGARPLIGRRTGVALVALGLALGAALGWSSRPEDLLSTRAAEPGKAPPGLWIAPRWRDVDKLNSAEDQYRYAQIRAPKDLQEAAWLAVPGHFPGSRDWGSRAYTQLARHLLLRGDAERLKVLAEELDRWNGSHTHEKELAEVIRAGVDALEGELDDVLNGLRTRVNPKNLTDPALLELCLEVTNQADRIVSRPGAALARTGLRDLHDLQRVLLNLLFQIELHEPLFNPLRPG
jgi:serine/threonine-protein kinase